MPGKINPNENAGNKVTKTSTSANKNSVGITRKTPTKAPAKTPAKAWNNWGSPQYAYDVAAAQAAVAGLPQLYSDPFGGADVTSLLYGGGAAGAGSGGGSGGGGGGGGGGAGGAAALAERKAALQAAQAAALQEMEWKNTADMGAYDKNQDALNGLYANQSQRIGGIVGELGAGAQAARGATAGAFAQGDSALAGLADRFQPEIAARSAAANQSLAAFGAGPIAGGASSGDALAQMLAAARAANTQSATSADTMYAGRQNVYNGLNADASLDANNRYTGLAAQLQAQRAQKAMANSSDKAKMAADYALQIAGLG